MRHCRNHGMLVMGHCHCPPAHVLLVCCANTPDLSFEVNGSMAISIPLSIKLKVWQLTTKCSTHPHQPLIEQRRAPSPTTPDWTTESAFMASWCVFNATSATSAWVRCAVRRYRMCSYRTSWHWLLNATSNVPLMAPKANQIVTPSNKNLWRLNMCFVTVCIWDNWDRYESSMIWYYNIWYMIWYVICNMYIYDILYMLWHVFTDTVWYDSLWYMIWFWYDLDI